MRPSEEAEIQKTFRNSQSAAKWPESKDQEGGFRSPFLG